MFSKIKIVKSMKDCSTLIDEACELIASADCIVIGAGAGLSAAAGLRYEGPDFERCFADFIRKYGITDLYSSGFYPFRTEEEYWACWARHINFIRFRDVAPLYRQLFELVRSKDYFVVTTNVDGQFLKTGFAEDRVFEVQGDYAYLQCAKGCHDTLYYDEELVKQMVAATEDCRIPSSMIPRCPVDGGKMAVHVRCDGYFVEDDRWHAASDRYCRFIEHAEEKRTVLLELGIGFNTPAIIRFPFEKMAGMWKNTHLVRINKDYSQSMFSKKRTIAIKSDISDVLNVISPVFSQGNENRTVRTAFSSATL